MTTFGAATVDIASFCNAAVDRQNTVAGTWFPAGSGWIDAGANGLQFGSPAGLNTGGRWAVKAQLALEHLVCTESGLGGLESRITACFSKINALAPHPMCVAAICSAPGGAGTAIFTRCRRAPDDAAISECRKSMMTAESATAASGQQFLSVSNFMGSGIG